MKPFKPIKTVEVICVGCKFVMYRARKTEGAKCIRCKMTAVRERSQAKRDVAKAKEIAKKKYNPGTSAKPDWPWLHKTNK